MASFGGCRLEHARFDVFMKIPNRYPKRGWGDECEREAHLGGEAKALGLSCRGSRGCAAREGVCAAKSQASRWGQRPGGDLSPSSSHNTAPTLLTPQPGMMLLSPGGAGVLWKPGKAVQINNVGRSKT